MPDIIGGYGGHISKGALGGGSEAAIPCVRTWGITHSANLNEAVCSASRGAKIRVDGNHTWSGQFTMYGASPSIWIGEKFEFEGAITGAAGAAVGASGDVICDSIALAWDQEGGGILGTTIAFTGSGVLTLGTVTVPADTSVPAPQSSKGLLLKLATPAASPSYASLGELRTMSLTFSQATQVAHTAAGAGWPTAVRGPLDAAFSATVYARDSDGWLFLPQPNSTYFAQLFVDDSTFWLIKSLKFGELSGMDVDIEGGTIVGATISGGFTAVSYYGAAWNLGKIVKPDTTIVWPELLLIP